MIVLLYLTYDLGKNEILFVKSEARLLDLSYGMISVWNQVVRNLFLGLEPQG